MPPSAAEDEDDDDVGAAEEEEEEEEAGTRNLLTRWCEVVNVVGESTDELKSRRFSLDAKQPESRGDSASNIVVVVVAVDVVVVDVIFKEVVAVVALGCLRRWGDAFE